MTFVENCISHSWRPKGSWDRESERASEQTWNGVVELNDKQICTNHHYCNCDISLCLSRLLLLLLLYYHHYFRVYISECGCIRFHCSWQMMKFCFSCSRGKTWHISYNHNSLMYIRNLVIESDHWCCYSHISKYILWW